MKSNRPTNFLDYLTIMLLNQTHAIYFRCPTKKVPERSCKHCSRLAARKKIWLGLADVMNKSMNFFLGLLLLALTINTIDGSLVNSKQLILYLSEPYSIYNQ